MSMVYVIQASVTGDNTATPPPQVPIQTSPLPAMARLVTSSERRGELVVLYRAVMAPAGDRTTTPWSVPSHLLPALSTAKALTLLLGRPD